MSISNIKDKDFFFEKEEQFGDSFLLLDHSNDYIVILNPYYLEEGDLVKGWRRRITKDFQLELFEVSEGGVTGFWYGVDLMTGYSETEWREDGNVVKGVY